MAAVFLYAVYHPGCQHGALSSKQPTEEGAGSPNASSDPLSSMMNFISDVNPLASVFKSPDGASRDVPSTRGTLP